MDDLVQWLYKQLDEDEAIARAASDGPWRSYRGPDKPWLSKGDLIHPVYTWDNAVGTPVIMTAFWADSRHIAEWNPQQMLREADAKRQILALHAKGASDLFCAHCEQEPPCPTLRLLALPYADRPGYSEEWRP